MQDELFFRHLQLESTIGVYAWERLKPQPLCLDLILTLNDNPACLSDCVEDALDYARLNDALCKYAKQTQYQLLEALAEDLAYWLFMFNPLIEKVDLTLVKPGILANVECVGIRIVRQRPFKKDEAAKITTVAR